jgi:hypothetical protein
MLAVLFHRNLPPDIAEEGLVRLLTWGVYGLLLVHVAAAGAAVIRWPRTSIVAVTLAQLACSLYMCPLTLMAVEGRWL